MLTVNTSQFGNRDCEGTSRRDFLRVGSLGLGAMSLTDLLASKAYATRAKADYIRDKAVVMLYLSGGASHIETFNPNMEAPSPYNSMTGEVETSLSGVTFGGTFPSLAKWAHKMAIVRSFTHPIGGHEQAHVHVLSGGTDPKDPRGDPNLDGQNRDGDDSTEGAVGSSNSAEGTDGWGDLPTHVRDTFRSEGRSELPARYRDWIDEYYRKMNRRGPRR